MREKQQTTKLPKPEPLPFFKKDSLVFLNSSHLLRLSNGYYRCDLDCKGKCEMKERQFKKELMEKRFTRFAGKFKITSDGAGSMVKKLFKKALIKIIDQEENDFGCEDIMETSIETARQDFKKKRKIKKSDLKDFEEALVKSNTLDRPAILLAYISGIIRSFSLNQAGIGRDLALVTKKIFISNSGEIESIEFERWGWYILNFIDKNFPNYFYNLKQQGVKILNKEDEILNLDVDEAIEYFDNNFEEALHNHSVTFFYSILSMLRKMVSAMTDGDPQKTNLAILKMYSEFATNPAIQLAFKLTPLVGLKLSKNRKK